MSEGTSVCEGCNGPIQNLQCIVAEGKKYHVEHFICKNCSSQLQGVVFRKKNNEIYCQNCYSDLFAFPCQGCSQKILGKHLVVDEKRFHSACFVCSNCTTQFGQTGYYNKNGAYLCQKCLSDLQNRFCAKCQNPCIENSSFCLGKYWHEDCFQCVKCNKKLTDTYINVDDHPYHMDCLLLNCIVCGLLVNEEYLEIDSETFCHPDCISKYKPVQKSSQKVQQEQSIQTEIQQTSQNQQPEQVEEQKHQQSKPTQTQTSSTTISTQTETEVQYTVKKVEQQDVNQLNPETLDPNRPRYPWAVLKQKPPPEDVVVNKKELYLSDEEFKIVFKMTLTKFLTLKVWKRDQLKKDAGIF